MLPCPKIRAISIERVTPREGLWIHQVVGLGGGFTLDTRRTVTRRIDRG